MFKAALERPAEVRLAFLSDACGGDEMIRREVESLLAALDDAGGFLESRRIDRKTGSVPARLRSAPAISSATSRCSVWTRDQIAAWLRGEQPRGDTRAEKP